MNRLTRLATMFGWFGTLGALLATLATSTATAQAPTVSPPRTTVIQTEVRDASLASLGRALTRVTASRAEALDVIALSGTPALGLEDLQLALGCIGETTECLGAVARQLEVEGLIVPSVEQADNAIVVSLLYFDGRNGQARRAARRATGDDAEEEILSAVEPILRELFGLPEQEHDALDLHGDGHGARQHEATTEEELPIAAIATAGGGVLLVAAGVVFGVLSLGSQSEFESATLDNDASVDAAIDAHDRAAWQAVTADVLFAAGAVAIATGVVLYFLGGADSDDHDDAAEVAFAPWVGPGTAGLVGSATW